MAPYTAGGMSPTYYGFVNSAGHDRDRRVPQQRSREFLGVVRQPELSAAARDRRFPHGHELRRAFDDALILGATGELTMTKQTTTRREFIARSSAAAAAASLAGNPALEALAQSGIPQRPIPSTGEMLPVIGLGSSKVVEQIAANGTEPLRGCAARARRARRQVRRHVAAQRHQRCRLRPRHRDARISRQAVRDDEDRSGRQGSRHQAVPRRAAELPARSTRPRADLQPDRSRHALAELEGVEGRGRRALHRRDGLARRAPRRPRAVPAPREAGFRADELFDHGARPSRSACCRSRRSAASPSSSTGRS